MSAALTTFLFDHGRASRSSHVRRIQPSTQPPPNMFNSLKKKLSRRGSNPLGSKNDSRSSPGMSPTSPSNYLQPPQSNNTFATGSSPTCRPIRSNMNAFTRHSDEPPPAYTPGPAAPGPSAELNTISLTATSGHVAPPTEDDEYTFLRSFDTIFLIDDSASMSGPRWRETVDALKAITPICTQRDVDGIDIYFLNHADSDLYKNVTSPGTVVEIFQTVRPTGGTPTGVRLRHILKPYLSRYEADPDNTKPINIIVITDGEASDDVESPIIEAAKKLDKLEAPSHQVGIQFFQVGRDPAATVALRQLDDQLQKKADIRDIVDTVPFLGAQGEKLSAAGLLKVVLGSVNRRLDRNSTDLHRKGP